MSSQIELVTVPDIGGAENVEVIEVYVKVGDHVTAEDPLATLEGDKATMDIPSPLTGVVKAMKLAMGDKISMGSPIVEIEVMKAKGAEKQVNSPAKVADEQPSTAEYVISLPDIGTKDDVKVIDIMVSVGETIEKESSILTLEGDKASMDVPSPETGVVKEILIAVGDAVREGSPVVILTTESVIAPVQVPAQTAAPLVSDTQHKPAGSGTTHASPAVRRLARELDINLSSVSGSGNKGRITKADLRSHLSGSSSSAGGSALGVLPMPKIDFSKFGDVETQSLSKIQKISGANLHRNWVSIPHVTQWADADITDLEEFRKREKESAAKKGIRLTPIVFLMKAAVAALKEFPKFNSSLSPCGAELIMKKYFHVGVAVDTPNGLVVPVIRDVDRKGIVELAAELASISKKARETGLTMAQMQGGCFTISSLGGIGGSAFTPIINAPEVAILGVSRTQQKPVWTDGDWARRAMLPLSLSYDHRVIDGADAARFVTYFAECLQDIRKLLM